MKRSSSYPGLLAALAAAGLLLAGTIGATFAAESGRQDYVKNCAGCHGADGKGNGPDVYVVPRMNPPDLTLLSKRNGGVFPFRQVDDAIDGRKGIPSHKRFDMPFWGVTLQEPGKEFTPKSEARAKARIDAVAHYLESIQRK